MVWFDRRGYGKNADADGAPAGVDRHIDDVVDVLDGRRAIVAGHSFGGVIAIGAAVRAPEAVDAVAVYETNMAWVAGLGRYRDAADLRRGRSRRRRAPHDAGDDRFDGLAGADRDRRMRDGRALHRRGAIRAHRDPAVRRPRPARPWSTAGATSASCPSCSSYLQRQRRAARCGDLPGAGHNAHRSDPGRVRRARRRARRPRRPHKEPIAVTDRVLALARPGARRASRAVPRRARRRPRAAVRRRDEGPERGAAGGHRGAARRDRHPDLGRAAGAPSARSFPKRCAPR